MSSIASEERILPRPTRVRRLEARFHPKSRANDVFIVVGYVVCDDGTARVEPARIPSNAAKPFNSAGLHVVAV